MPAMQAACTEIAEILADAIKRKHFLDATSTMKRLAYFGTISTEYWRRRNHSVTFFAVAKCHDGMETFQSVRITRSSGIEIP